MVIKKWSSHSEDNVSAAPCTFTILNEKLDYEKKI